MSYLLQSSNIKNSMYNSTLVAPKEKSLGNLQFITFFYNELLLDNFQFSFLNHDLTFISQQAQNLRKRKN